MKCRKHQIDMIEINGNHICLMCKKGIPDNIIFFEKGIQNESLPGIERRLENSEILRKKKDGEIKEKGTSKGTI